MLFERKWAFSNSHCKCKVSPGGPGACSVEKFTGLWSPFFTSVTCCLSAAHQLQHYFQRNLVYRNELSLLQTPTQFYYIEPIVTPESLHFDTVVTLLPVSVQGEPEKLAYFTHKLSMAPKTARDQIAALKKMLLKIFVLLLAIIQPLIQSYQVVQPNHSLCLLKRVSQQQGVQCWCWKKMCIFSWNWEQAQTYFTKACCKEQFSGFRDRTVWPSFN